MNHICPMSDLKPEQIGLIKKMDVKGSMRRRLQDLGLIEGSNVECVLTSPGGNPSAYKIKDTVIAIRNEDCGNIDVVIYN